MSSKVMHLNQSKVLLCFQHQYESALFWAEKAVTLSNGKSNWYIKCAKLVFI